MYKYILFDADNTLLDFDKAEKVSIFNTFSYFGVNTKYSKRFSEINSSLWKLFEVGGIKREEIKTKRFELLLNEIGNKDISASEMSDYYLTELSCSSYTYDDASYICSELCKMGKKIYIITNGHTVTQTKRLRNCNFIDFVEKIFISEKIGYQKPSIEYFDFVLNDISVDKKDCIIIGDSLSSDIKGGVTAKIDTCWFNPNNKVNTTDIVPTYTVSTLKEILDIFKE